MIFPTEFNTDNKSKAEETLYLALKKLFREDNEVHVFHSVMLSNRESRRSECEIDFVVLSKKYIVCIEVKGGRIDYNPQLGIWTQNGNSLKDPIKQAISNEHVFIKRFHSELKEIQVYWAVCFPDMNIGNAPLPPSVLPHNVIDGNQIGYLIDYFGSIESHAYSLNKGDVFPSRNASFAFKQIIGVLSRAFNFEPSMASALSREQEKFSSLLKEQIHAISAISDNDRILVRGPAGSGKSLIGLHQLFNRYESGERVLFLSFNRALARNLAYKASREYSIDEEADLEITTFHSWARKIIGNSFPGWWESHEKDQDFWDLDVAIKLLEIQSISAKKYDFIVVDEAQDFDDVWFDPVEKSLNESGKMAVLIDPMQDIFNRSNSFKNMGFTTFHLSRVIRSSKNITDYVSSECELSLVSHEDCPQGIDVIDLTSVEKKKEGLQAQLKRLGVHPSSIVVLYDPDIGYYGLNGLEFSRHRLTQSRDGRVRKGQIPCTSIKQYKGLEKEVVVLAEYKRLEDARLRYVGLSRAQNVLILC